MVPCGSFDPECPCCSLPESQRAACEADEPPCEDLPLKTMEIASPGASGKNGGRYGMTRSSGTQPHHGLDIAAEKGTYVYSPFSGKVSNIDSSFSPGQYGKDSYGNFVTVESTDANGNIFYLRYCHLDYDLVEFGDEIEVGQVIGIAGDTGNAQKVTNKHVHIYGAKKDSNGNIIRTNPEDYLKTKWDSSGNISVNPCNN
jgi:murein DD-endopeptidase MepM/ murein hydrolase activator NlpD